MVAYLIPKKSIHLSVIHNYKCIILEKFGSIFFVPWSLLGQKIHKSGLNINHVFTYIIPRNLQYNFGLISSTNKSNKLFLKNTHICKYSDNPDTSVFTYISILHILQVVPTTKCIFYAPSTIYYMNINVKYTSSWQNKRNIYFNRHDFYKSILIPRLVSKSSNWSFLFAET